MGKSIVTFKIMPSSPEVDAESLAKQCVEMASSKGVIGESKYELVPLAFGLKSIKMLSMIDTDANEPDLILVAFEELDDVGSASIEKIDLALG